MEVVYDWIYKMWSEISYFEIDRQRLIKITDRTQYAVFLRLRGLSFTKALRKRPKRVSRRHCKICNSTQPAQNSFGLLPHGIIVDEKPLNL